MLKEAKELIGGPGRYEGLTAFEAWLCENVDACADMIDGDVEYGLWFALCGRHIVSTDDRGFWYVTTYRRDGLGRARRAFDDMADEYSRWIGADDDDEPATDGPMVGAYVTDGRGIAYRVRTDDYCGNLTAVMVGDDHVHHLSAADVTAVDPDDVCSCGSLGCWSPNNLK